MKTIVSIAIALFLSVTPVLQAQDDQGCQDFIDSLTKTLKTKDKNAFYRLVCFDGMDEAWKKISLQGFDIIFFLTETDPEFSITMEAPNPEKLKPMPFKKGEIVYNLEVKAVCVIHLPDTERDKNVKCTLNLGEKDGKMLIACYILKSEDSQ